MKKGSAILVIFVLLVSGMHISIDRHYCGGTLADVKVSVTGKLASCGMEQAEPECRNQSMFDQKCCGTNYFPEYNNIMHPVSGTEIIFLQRDNHITVSSFNTISYFRVLPPGNNVSSRLTQPDICVFRI